MSKSLQDYFYDWYNHAFGYGYGTGDVYYCEALTKFFHALSKAKTHSSYGYKYEEMERVLGGAAFWLLINTLCVHDIVDYGTSPRYGWLTDKGERLRMFLSDYDATDLYNLYASYDEDFIICYPTHCNHTNRGKKGCFNPFWSNEWSLEGND